MDENLVSNMRDWFKPSAQHHLKTIDQIRDTAEAPLNIVGTGKRESLEPKLNGVIHGNARYYHPNGQLYSVITWINGKKEGTHLLRREDGSSEQFLSYKDGLPNGINVWMDSMGYVATIAEYYRGTPKIMVIGDQQGQSLRCQIRVNFAELKDLPYPNLAARERCLEGPSSPSEAPHPSFNCYNVKLESEKLICSLHKLSQQDVEIDQLFNRGKKNVFR
jgi:hypothetical protein